MSRIGGYSMRLFAARAIVTFAVLWAGLVGWAAWRVVTNGR